MQRDGFPKDMRNLLLKKEKEYGQLKFISSRATEETSCFIDELLEDVANIVKKYNMYNVKLFYEDSFKPSEIPAEIIKYYNHFVLNTNFSSQYLLGEDILIGYAVNFWPTLSPYLFIQMIRHLKWEHLLIESLVHLPLDLCVEILEITIRCINELKNLQDRRFVYLLISKLYYKCMWLHLGTLAKRDVAELSCQLVAYFQTLLDLVSTKFITPQLSQQEKYVQHGILLKYVLRCVKMCMHHNTKNSPECNDFMQTFKVTYGNSTGLTDYFCKLPIDNVQSTMATLNQELVTLLEDQIKQVDCLEFMEWAEIDDEENVTISLQRAIIIECYCFVEFMKSDEFLVTNEHLFHCLQQLVGSSKSEESILTLEELCDNITNGKLDEKTGLKELIKRYKKWNLSVLNIISKKTKLLDVKDLGILLEYLHYIFEHQNISEEKHQAYLLVIRMLVQEPLSTMYHLVLQYTLRHFHDNRLACLFNSTHFKKFIETSLSVHDQYKLRIILIFVLLNPKKVLTTLVRVAIGSTEAKYQNIIFRKSQLAYLHTFLTSKLDDQNNLLTYLLNDAWLHDRSVWCYKQFASFMSDMFETEAITPDDLLKNVYIPCLSDVSNCSNLLSVLMHIFSMLKKNICKYPLYETNYVQLIIQLTKKISLIRKCKLEYSKNTMNNLLNHGTMILRFLFAKMNLTLNSQNEIIMVNKFVEPIDQILLAPELETMLHGTVQDVIQTYERRCLATYQLLRVNPQCESKMYDYVHSFQLDQKSLLHHMMLHATEEEYKNFAIEMTVVSWAYFGWANEYIAYKNVLRITTEAMQLALTFTDTFPKDTFVSLLRALVQYCNLLLRLMYRRKEAICSSLLTTLFSLKSIVNETQYDKTYNEFIDYINNIYNKSEVEIIDYVDNIRELIEVFFVQCEEIENETSDNLKNGNSHYASPTIETLDMFKAYQFVCECIDGTLQKKNFADH